MSYSIEAYEVKAAEEEIQGEVYTEAGVEYRILDGEASVIGYTGAIDDEIVLLQEVKGTKVVSIEEEAFFNCERLKKITLSPTIERIEDATKYGSMILERNGAFSVCSNLEEVVIPENSKLSYIGEWTFNRCTKLKSITLPKALRKIGAGSFYECNSIKNLDLPEGLESVDDDAFTGISITKLHIPSTCTYFRNINDMFELESITVAEGNPEYTVIDDVMIYQNEEIYLYPLAKKDTVYHVPEGIMVCGLAFTNAQYLKELDIGNNNAYGLGKVLCDITVGRENPWYIEDEGLIYNAEGTVLERIPASKTGEIKVKEGVKYVKDYVAWKASCSAIIFPEGVIEVGEYAFANCSNLKAVEFSKGIEYMGPELFLKSSIEKVKFPQDLKVVSQGMFIACENLKSIRIPASVQSIEHSVFGDCSSLKEIYFEGTIPEIAEGTFNNEYSNEDPINVYYFEEYNKDSEDKFKNYGGKLKWIPYVIQKEQKITASSVTKTYESKAFYLNAKTNGDGKFSYTSSNKKTAIISSGGKVTIKGYGSTTITIRAAATKNYKAATKKITIKVVPKKGVLTSLTSPSKKKIKVVWKKNATVTGYQIYISKKKDFSKYTKQNKYPVKKTSVTVSGWKSRTTYYVKVRSYKKVGKSNYYGSWSSIRSIRVK